MDKEYTDLGSAADYLHWLEDARREREQADRDMAKCVRGARAQGASWAQIGRQIGVSKQAAQKKYGVDGAWTALDTAQHGTPERKAAAVEAFEAAATKANQDDPWAEPAAPVPTHAPNGDPIYLPSIGDTPASRKDAERDDYGTTPVDLAPPAKRWDGAADSLGRPVYWLEGAADATAQPGTGVGDHNCPRCQSTNHKGGAWHTVAAFKECEPTRFDPQNIVDWFYRGLGVRKSK